MRHRLSRSTVSPRFSGPADDAIGRRVAAQRLDMRLSRCVAVDLEVSKGTGLIHAFAGIRPDTRESVVFPGV